jgi:transposase-like protein
MVVELCKEHGISTSTFYRWRATLETQTHAAARHPKKAAGSKQQEAA